MALTRNLRLQRSIKQNIQRLANLYFAYQMKHEWHGPPDENAFEQFLRGYSPVKANPHWH